MHREGLSLRHRTSICQKIPANFQEKLLNFQRYIIQLRKKQNYVFKHIGNAGEMAVYFGMPQNYTVDAKCAKEIKIRSTGYEKQLVMVMLCITADGHKLPPYVILNRKTIPKNEMFAKDVIVRAQKNGWMTVDLVEDWVKNVWERYPGALQNPPSTLVLDAFHGHLPEELKVKLESKNCDLVVTPDGMTSQLKPLDVSVNKPFKDYLRKEYEAWLLSENLPLVPSGKINRASASKLAKWVLATWKKIAGKTVEQSFKKCGITNTLDSTEEDIL
jgi:hypothetical protein